jgi:hypothetical protein
MKGVYFYDTVSNRLGMFEFCGSKTFAFSGTYPNGVSISGLNGDILTLKAASDCNPGVYNVTVLISMSQNISNSIFSNFSAAVILVSPSKVANQYYTL